MTQRQGLSRTLAPVSIALCPVVLIACLLGVYLVSPDFYLLYILEGTAREGQAVELLTFGASLLAFVVLGLLALRFWTERARRGTGSGAILVAGVALACFFFAGEEVSWGQSLLGEKVIDASFLDDERDSNIHNGTDIPVQSIGSAFLVVFFVVLPFLWRSPVGERLPADWEPAVPSRALAVAMRVSFVWGKLNNVYVGVVPHAKSTGFYDGFVHHVNEQKEMLFAVVLLLYAFERVAWWNRGGAVPGPATRESGVLAGQ